MTSAEKLAALETALLSAKSEMETSERTAAISALRGVITFLDSDPDWYKNDLSLPLGSLLMGMQDLDEGITVPQLEPAIVRNRKPDDRRRKIVKSYAAYSIDILMLNGASKQDACAFIARQLKRSKFRIGGDGDTLAWKTIRNWRDRLSKLPTTDQTRCTYEGLKAEFGTLKFASLADARGRVAKGMREALCELPGA
jgi:hypothetical protein